jgi:predicted nuclease of predicted toxin-antitoxin system
MWVLLEEPPKKLLREIHTQIAERARCVVDESLGSGVARVMKDLGWNVVFAPEVGLGGRSDEDVFAFAWSEDRVLLTHDHDFLDDRRFPFTRNPGVVVLPGGDGKGDGLVNALRETLSLVGNMRRLFECPKIEISEDGTWNVREFNRGEGRHTRRRLRFGKHGKVWEWQGDNA